MVFRCNAMSHFALFPWLQSTTTHPLPHQSSLPFPHIAAMGKRGRWAKGLLKVDQLEAMLSPELEAGPEMEAEEACHSPQPPDLVFSLFSCSL